MPPKILLGKELDRGRGRKGAVILRKPMQLTLHPRETTMALPLHLQAAGAATVKRC